ncbi:MAG: ABC transporter permease [Candidatus Marinimicrobia bacterium]|nr:ABC transporter permease [Candidatus Neomarinimicrobiota bacterium]
MKFHHYIAKRFALGGKGAGASRFIGWIAILGMGIGCFALVLAVSVLQGFESKVIEKIIGFESDIRIHGSLKDEDLSEIRDLPDIQSIIPFMERKGLIHRKGNDIRLITLKAINPSAIDEFYDIIIPDREKTSTENPVYVGQTMAMRLNVRVGDQISLMSPVDTPGIFGLPKIISGTIAGIFSAEVLQFDDDIAFIPMDVGQALFSRKAGVDGYDVRLKSSELASDVKQNIQEIIPETNVETWTEMHEALFNAMRMERIGAILILSLIIIVAAFNLATTLVLVSSQKVSELGMLRAMGTDKSVIEKIIFRQGILIGGSGAIAGFVLGCILIFIQILFEPITLPADIYFSTILPVELTLNAALTIIIIAMISIVFASKLAASRLRFIDPINTLFMEK